MTEEILTKLRRELDAGIHTEVQVVYVMAAIRKLMERDGSSQSYANLHFFCNWALHSKLDQSAAIKILVQVDDIFDAAERGDYKASEESWSKVDELTDGNRLREQLLAFLQKYQLPEAICTDEGAWHEFHREYVAVVSDIPLEINIPVRHIRRLVLRRSDRVSALIKQLRPEFESDLNLAWSVTKMTGEEQPLRAISIPRPPQSTSPQTPPLPAPQSRQ
jgi:hypothetical protein